MHKIATVKNVKPLVNPYVMIGFGIICISFGSVFAKMSAAPALVIATYRLTFASLFLTPYALWKNRQELKKLSPKVFLWALLSGAFLALHFATWISSLKYINVSSSVVLVALQPVFVALGSFFIFREKIPLKALLAGMLALSGTFVIGLGDLELGKTALWGDILAVTGAVFAAAYWMVGRSLRQILSLTAYTYVVYTTCALLLFLFTAGRGIPLFGYSARDWLLFLGLALIPTLGGHSSFNWALAYVQSIVVSLAILGEAVGATVLAFLLLGEMPGSLELIGGIIILAGLYLFLINNKEA
ncbi:DMT family transporter [Zhaonella formicivorans]|uniref:DMT family transporter n=1 Tax=Zhaonella formicivorans TaxID=2528593 RepID=UPI0010E2BA6B|nr:DMT family transporter [Zhaonella formicivorans]